jgi:hypothetical protein
MKYDLMIDWTSGLITRDGRKAELLEIHHKKFEGPYATPMYVAVHNKNGKIHNWHYMVNGQFKSNEPGHIMDLMNVRWLM